MTRALTALVAVLVLTSAHEGERLWAQSRPDFTGVWTDYVDPQQPAGATGGPAAAALDLPLTPDARRKFEGYRKPVAPTGDTPGAYCLGPGMPSVIFGGATYPMEIIHRPEQITIIYELHNHGRRLYIGSRNVPEADRLPGRNGYSAARWEGDTLIVETTKLVEQVDQRYPHSDSALGIGRPRVRGRVPCAHSVQHIEVRDDRGARIEPARVDRVDDTDVAPGLGDRRRSSGLLVAAAGEHDVPDRTGTQAADGVEHTCTHRRGLRIDNQWTLGSDLHRGVAAGTGEHVDASLGWEHDEIALRVDERRRHRADRQQDLHRDRPTHATGHHLRSTPRSCVR
jgi:hypothetical protein